MPASMRNQWSLLSFTDLHFRASSNFTDEDKTGLETDYRRNVFQVMKYILGGFPQASLDGIIIAGDITTRGLHTGFEEFKAYAEHMKPLLKEHAQLYVVPGNHDVKWGLWQKESNYFEQKFAGFADVVRTLNAVSCLLPKGSVATDKYEGISF